MRCRWCCKTSMHNLIKRCAYAVCRRHRKTTTEKYLFMGTRGTAWTICMLIKMHQSLAHSKNNSSSNSRALCARSMQTPAASPEHGTGTESSFASLKRSTPTDSQTINVFVWILMMTVGAKYATAKSNQNRRMNVINYACNYSAKGPFPGTCRQPMTAWYLC